MLLGFTEEEKTAMKDRAKELKAEARANKKREDGEKEVLEKIAEMQEPDKSIAKRLHQLITSNAPELSPKTWYGMPTYAKQDKVLCFFQSGQKFKSRYSTFGFTDQANLDTGDMWATGFALKKLTKETEKQIIKLVEKAVTEK